MNGPDSSFDSLPLATKQRIDDVCARFERTWAEGVRPSMRELVDTLPEEERPFALVELILIESEYLHKRGESLCFDEYAQLFPGYEAWLRKALPGDATEPLSAAPETPPEIPDHVIIGELGRGGMGIVYSARHKPLNRIVAIKCIHPGRKADALHHQRFRQEAEAIARLRHPNIVAIYDIGEVPGGLFLALEYADGGSLRDRMNGEPLNPYLAAKLLEPIVRAVMHAHRHGVIHRDIKPANVLLTVSGDSIALENQRLPDFFARPFPLQPMEMERISLRECTPKLSDFGLARLVDYEQSGMELGMAAGTPYYMSPEQARGERDYTVEVDIWALGATLYEMLTGRPPFQGSTSRETLTKILFEEPVPPRVLNQQVPAALEAICLKCLRKDPEQRYSTARDLAQELNTFLTEPPSPPSASFNWALWAGIGVALSVGIGLVMLGWLGR
jgi:serine/threonine protein kinase